MLLVSGLHNFEAHILACETRRLKLGWRLNLMVVSIAILGLYRVPYPQSKTFHSLINSVISYIILT